LDDVAKTGRPVTIERNGVELSIIRKPSKVSRRRVPRTLPNLIVGDPDDLIHVEWPWTRGEDL
jgi:hypothetical protein